MPVGDGRVTTTITLPQVVDFPAAGGWRVAAATRTGSQRETNEDGWLVVPAEGHRPLLVAVADGVGGEAAGERASRRALEVLEEDWRAWTPGESPAIPDVGHRLRDAARRADAAVRALPEIDPSFQGAATTLTAAAMLAERVVLAHAGDSRAYRVDRGSGAALLTRDHTWVDEEVVEGRMTAAEAAKHPMRNVITRFLGHPHGCVFDVLSEPRAPGDWLLLCTDGVSNIIGEPELGTNGKPSLAGVRLPAVWQRGSGVRAPEAASAATAAPGVAAHAERIMTSVARRNGGDDATLVVAGPATPAAAPLGEGAPAAAEADPFGLRRAEPTRTSSRRPLLLAAVAGVVGVGGAAAWAVPRVVDEVTQYFRPPAQPVAERYLAAWSAGRYADLYALLSPDARRAIAEDAFVTRHQAIAAEMTLTGLSARAAADAPQVSPSRDEVVVAFDATYATARYGELQRRNELRLVWDEAWAVDWTPAVILPELTRGRLVRAFADSALRGSVLDRRGLPFATSTPGSNARSYAAGSLAGPLVGYTGQVSAEDLASLAAKGYVAGDAAGKAGVEAAAEAILAGQRGGRLTVIEPTGDVAATLSSVPPRAGETVTLSIDQDIQRHAEASLGQRVGSAVVIDPRSGAIRALATWPRYDPNAFVTGEGVAAILNDPAQPLVNRPVQGQYPAGSTFKVVTMAAGLESGAFQPDSQFTCTGRWTGLPGLAFDCWLKTGHGRISLVDGLTHSCNTVFYEIGKRLDEIDAGYLPAFASRCGFGTPTGALPGFEPSGVVPSPAWKQQALRSGWARGDAVNMAIGQGQLLVTPLQLAHLYAAIAAGGQPGPLTLLERAQLPGGNVERSLAPKEARSLDWSAPTLEAVRTGLRNVVGSPQGTAAAVFQGSHLAAETAGKTGTAETVPGRNPHAWFACYAPADAPRAVVLMMFEHAGEGSRVAAPAARGLLETVLDRM